MNLWTIVIILVALSLVGALPVYGYNRGWGYGPFGGLGGLLVLLIVLWAIFGRGR